MYQLSLISLKTNTNKNCKEFFLFLREGESVTILIILQRGFCPRNGQAPVL